MIDAVKPGGIYKYKDMRIGQVPAWVFANGANIAEVVGKTYAWRVEFPDGAWMWLFVSDYADWEEATEEEWLYACLTE